MGYSEDFRIEAQMKKYEYKMDINQKDTLLENNKIRG